MSTHYAIDSLAMRTGRVFGWGWVLAPDSPARQVEIRVPLADGGESRLACLRGGSRPDLSAAFPDIAHAGGGGFLIQGRLPDNLSDAGATLHVTYENGRSETHAIDGFPYRFMPMAATPQVLRSKIGSALRRLRDEGVASVSSRTWTVLREGWTRSRDKDKLGRVARADDSGGCVIVFDHAMGGGANRFRDAMIAGAVQRGDRVYLVTPDLPTLSYQILCRTTEGDQIAAYGSLPEALAVLDCLPLGELVINDLVSFDDPIAVLAWAKRRREGGGQLTFYVHDYFCACPSWTLVDHTSRFCHLPAPDACRTCLANNPIPFRSFYSDLDVPTWRAAWRDFLLACDRLVAFSQASADIVLRAHPALDAARLAVEPHVVDYLPDRRVAPSFDDPLVVGIIGHISVHKGADVLRAAVAHAMAQDAPIRFVVIGTVDNACPSTRLAITGPYDAERLPDLLAQHRVGICLLPSICPETFSYVTSEIIHFGMPLAVFDLGAPAERARAYAAGRILPAMDGRSVVEALLTFRDELAARAAPQDQETRINP